jgi:hypothetical protein
MPLKKDICNFLGDENPDALLWDGFEEAFIGTGVRCAQPSLAVYDYNKMVRVLVKRDKMTHEDAEEYISFNVTGGWVGKNTPIALIRIPKPD